MLLAELARTSEAVAGTSARRAKVELLAGAVAGLAPEEVTAGVAFLSGETRQRQTRIGFAALREPPAPAAEPTLHVADVDAALEESARLAGAGSQGGRAQLVAALLARATADEQRFLVRLLLGDLRQGALAGVMVEAIARAAGVPAAEVRRALMLRGELGAVAEAALTGGSDALQGFSLEVGRPLQPMLAQSADDVGEALERIAPAAVEWKLDGARVQVHRLGQRVRVFSRSLDELTERVPEVVDAALALPVESAVLDGEVIALRADGRPQPFQVTGSRVATGRDPESLRRSVPLSLFLFDVLHLDGEDVLDRPARERHAALARAAPEALRVPRIVARDGSEAEAFMADALARGHEGVVVKALDAPYEAGRRGAGWIKVKPRHTLDLVVLAAEWGHGRRRGFLSNLHLGARGEEGFVMLGKTFKGLTDEMLAWQTEQLLELEERRDRHVVWVRPQLVVEIAFDGVQTSPRYPGGMALRFARVKGYRPDKRADEADTIETVRAIHAGAHGPAG